MGTEDEVARIAKKLDRIVHRKDSSVIFFCFNFFCFFYVISFITLEHCSSFRSP